MKKTLVKAFALFLAIAMTAGVLGGCDASSGNGSTGEKQTVKVGVMCPLSGTAVRMGEIYKAAVETAYKHIEEDGFLKNYELEFEYVDDKADTAGAPTAANYVINNMGAKVSIGHLLTTMILVSGSYFEEAQIPLIGVVSGPASVAQSWKYTFIATATDLIQADTMLEYLVKEKGFKKIAIANVNTEGGMSAATRLIDTLKSKYSLEAATHDQFAGDDTDFTSQVLKMKNASADCVIFWGGSQAQGNIFMKQMEQMWGKVPENVYFCGGTSFGQAQMLEAWDKADLAKVAFPIGFVATDSTLSTRFVKDYKAVDTQGQDPADIAARVYDSVYFIANALNKLGVYDVNSEDFSAKLRDAMANTSFDGVQGHFDYSKFTNGEGLANISICEWNADGTYSKVYPKN